MSVNRPILRFVLAVVARPKTTIAVCLALAAMCIAISLAKLNISTDQNKLFSPKVPFFRDFLEFNEKFPENEAIYVVIETRDPKARPPINRWTAAADAVGANLRAIPRHVASVEVHVPIDRLGRQAILFDTPQRVVMNAREAREFSDLIRTISQVPDWKALLLGRTPLDRLFSSLSIVPDPRSAGLLAMIAQSLARTLEDERIALPNLVELGAQTPRDLGYSFVPDETDKSRSIILVRVYPKRDYTSLTAIAQTVESIRHAVREGIAPLSEFQAGVTGRPALEADEMSTTDRDATRAEIVALTAVFIGLAIFFRSLWLAAAAEVALGVGIAWTFGFATLTVGELNLLSIVFLLALIGIGMDYLIQILSRYRREMARRKQNHLVWVAVFRQVGAPINTACMGAAGAFLVSLFTDFKGAADLGLIAGGGLLLCLISGYTFLPALLTLFPMKRPRISKQHRHSERAREESSLARQDPPILAYAQHDTPHIRRPSHFITPAIWLVLILIGIPFALRTGFNPSLIDLQAPDLESVQLVRKLQSWSAVALSKDLAALRAARDAMKDAPTVALTESILDAHDNITLLQRQPPMPAIAWAKPGDITDADLPRLAGKASRLATQYRQMNAPDARQAADALERFAGFAHAKPSGTAQRLSAWQVAFITLLKDTLAQFTPQPLDVAAIPTELRSHFVSTDGVFALYILPKEDLWNQHNLDAFVRDVEGRLAKLPQATFDKVKLTGIAHNIHHTTSSIRRSFYTSTFYALGLIFLLVLIDLRHLLHTLFAISVLALGLPMLVALMGLFSIDWNFANFFGLPILIGAGHEYGVFMVHRYRESLHDPRRTWRGWDVADNALLLCAFTVSTSFGFFALLANHRGLKSLGLVMAIGSACIYLATLLVLRPLLKWHLNRIAHFALPRM